VANRAPDTFIEKARLAIGSGRSTTWDKPWVPASALSAGATLTVGLGPAANPAWGTNTAAAPPSFSEGAAPAVPFTTPGGALALSGGGSATFLLGVQEENSGGASVSWHVVNPGATGGVTVSPDSGTFTVVDGRSTASLGVTAVGPGVHPITFALTQGGRSLPSLTLDVDVATS
jgi:hypothetical protein